VSRAGQLGTEVFNLWPDSPIGFPKEFSVMIELTRLNGNPMVLNSDLIKTAESSPDTMLTLINGEKLIVREEVAEVVERVLAYRARLLATVARRLSSFAEVERLAGLTSLDPTAQAGPSSSAKPEGGRAR